MERISAHLEHSNLVRVNLECTQMLQSLSHIGASLELDIQDFVETIFDGVSPTSSTKNR